MSAGMGVKDEYLLWLELQSCHPVGWLCFISGNTLPLFPSQKYSVFKSVSYKLCISSLSPSSRTLTSLPSLSFWFRLHLYLILFKFKTTKYYFQNSPYFLIVSSNIWPLHIFHKKLFSPWLSTSWLMQKLFFHIFPNIFAKCCCMNHTFRLVWPCISSWILSFFCCLSKGIAICWLFSYN